MLRAQQLDGVDQSMSSETPDRQSDDGTEQIPDVREPKSSEAWHPVYLVTADEIPDQKLDCGRASTRTQHHGPSANHAFIGAQDHS